MNALLQFVYKVELMLHCEPRNILTNRVSFKHRSSQVCTLGVFYGAGSSNYLPKI